MSLRELDKMKSTDTIRHIAILAMQSWEQIVPIMQKEKMQMDGSTEITVANLSSYLANKFPDNKNRFNSNAISTVLWSIYHQLAAAGLMVRASNNNVFRYKVSEEFNKMSLEEILQVIKDKSKILKGEKLDNGAKPKKDPESDNSAAVEGKPVRIIKVTSKPELGVSLDTIIPAKEAEGVVLDMEDADLRASKKVDIMSILSMVLDRLPRGCVVKISSDGALEIQL